MRLGEPGRPLVIGHRGAPVLAPENTIESFRSAVDAGADAVELDVGGGLVVAHSEHEIPDHAPTLDEALAFLSGCGVGVLVDLKQPGIEPAVAAALERHGLRGRALVSSTSRRALRRLKGSDPGLTRAIAYPSDRYRISRFSWPDGVAAGAAAAARSAMPLRAALLLASADVSVLALHHTLVSPAVVAAARSRGAGVVAWTVNDPARVAVLAGLGVAGIVTDDPGKVREALATLISP